ncbi:MAG: metallophosphoesterase [Caulobacterales bacterium]|nr:metallophosphoesterase [Caulobacterales bacterium]
MTSTPWYLGYGQRQALALLILACGLATSGLACRATPALADDAPAALLPPEGGLAVFSSVREVAVERADGLSPWSASLELTTPGTYHLHGRALFDLAAPQAVPFYRLTKPIRAYGRLNGQQLPLPLPGLWYEAIPAIPATLFRQGRNVLELEWPEEVTAAHLAKQGRLAIALAATLGVEPALGIESGPVLGQAGSDHATLACRTSRPALVELVISGQRLRSGPGHHHAFRIGGLLPDTVYPYALTATDPTDGSQVACPEQALRTFPAGPAAYRFVVFGDTQANPGPWRQIALAALAERPLFSVFVGDLTDNGLESERWNREFFTPAAELLATVPSYVVLGNHEYGSPLVPRLFPAPDGRTNWQQRIGPLTLIGIDGGARGGSAWSEPGPERTWLEDTLAARGGLRFLVTHYPPLSSGHHYRRSLTAPPGDLDVPTRVAREALLPLLRRAGLDAVLCGHEHFYQRLEPEGGPSIIVTVAGARMGRATAEVPGIKVTSERWHYLLMEVTSEHCVMTAKAVDGTVLDRREWMVPNVTGAGP